MPRLPERSGRAAPGRDTRRRRAARWLCSGAAATETTPCRERNTAPECSAQCEWREGAWCCAASPSETRRRGAQAGRSETGRATEAS
jgi:hypothetical protein